MLPKEIYCRREVNPLDFLVFMMRISITKNTGAYAYSPIQNSFLHHENDGIIRTSNNTDQLYGIIRTSNNTDQLFSMLAWT